MVYIALLRGVNVGGHQVKMERVREIFRELGFSNVRSYIQSGNIFFETDDGDRDVLTQKIEKKLHAELGYEVPVFLRTISEFEALLALDPFKKRKVTDDMRLCIVFTKDTLAKDLKLPMISDKKDLELVQVAPNEAFVIWYIINGRPPSSMTFLDKIIGKRTTTRFIHTAAKILAAAKQENP